VSAEVSGSALTLAVALHGASNEKASVVMDTSRSPETASMCLSIAESWNSILAEVLSRGSTFTIETATALTTTLKTLSCLLSATIPESIIKVVSRPVGSWLSADIAESHSSADAVNSTPILNAIAREIATLQHGDGSTDAKSAEPISPAIIQSVDSVLRHALTEIATESDSPNLRPNYEPIILARKPFPSTVASQVLATGTGALNIGASRVAGGMDDTPESWAAKGAGGKVGANGFAGQFSQGMKDAYRRGDIPLPAGRWPPNVILDPTAAQLLDAMSGDASYNAPATWRSGKKGDDGLIYASGVGDREAGQVRHAYGDRGGPSRFFPVLPVDDPDTLRFMYQPKASRAERNAGLEGMPERAKEAAHFATPRLNDLRMDHEQARNPSANSHPCVKPVSLMKWLLTLVTPPGGIVLDPFAGSGTTGVAAAQLGFPCILIEQDEQYCEIAAKRIEHALANRERRTTADRQLELLS
jgi:hypothetical protein